MSTAPGRRRLAGDLALVVAGPATVFALASRFEWFERFNVATRALEGWQADEAIFGLATLALLLAWFAWRRMHDAREALAQREHAQAQASALLARNRELAQSLIELQESERRSLARELHDELGQRCNTIQIEAALIARVAQQPAAVVEAAQRIGASAQTLYGQVRTMLRRLRPMDLDALGLLPALQAQCEQWSASQGVPCRYAVDGTPQELSDAANVAIYRVVQEGLANVRRHADARHVRVGLAFRRGGAVEVVVEDDGRGFDADADHQGLGLLGARERAAALGGTLAIRSRAAHPGAAAEGTALRLQLPAAARAVAAHTEAAAA